MIDSFSISVFIFFAIIAANLPWVFDKSLLLFLKPTKTLVTRWFEWFVMYLLCGVVAKLFEDNVTGLQSSQGWEFYVITLCLFVVFALPGFLYFVDLKKMLENR